MTIDPATELLLFILIWRPFPASKLKNLTVERGTVSNGMSAKFIQFGPRNTVPPTSIYLSYSDADTSLYRHLASGRG